MDIHVQLITAADQGDATMVQHCLDNGADPLFWDSHALTRAVANNHIDVVKILIPVSDVNAFNAVALRTAIDFQHHEIVDVLWDRVNHPCIMSQSNGAPSPFHVACQNGLFDRALSVLHHVIHSTGVRECLEALNKNTTDPKELKIWKELIHRSPSDHILYFIESAIPKELPRVEILHYMFEALSVQCNGTKLCKDFIKEISDNPYATHHISSLYPVFKHLYATLDPNVKIQVLAQTLQHNMLLAQEMIEHCRQNNVQLLQPDMMLYALKGDMSLLNHCLNVWGSQRWVISGAQATHQYDHILSSHSESFPHKVLRVLEEHPQFHTPKVLLALLEHSNDDITARIQLWVQDEEKTLYDMDGQSVVWNYWQDYKNREQKAIIEQHVDPSASTHSRKM